MHSGDEYASAAEDVPGAAAEQQQAAEGEGIRVHDPFQAGAGEAERMLDVWQGDVHDRRVKHHLELGGRDDGQGQSEATAPLLRLAIARSRAVRWT